MAGYLSLLLLAAVAVHASYDEDRILNGSKDKPLRCQGLGGNNLETFFDPETKTKGKNVKPLFPCKYWALRRQQCGEFTITLTAGQRWLYPKFNIDALWFSFFNAENSEYIEANIRNKRAAKFYNSMSVDDTNLFSKKYGNMTTASYRVERDDENHWLSIVGIDSAGQDVFSISYSPWDPEARKDGEKTYKWMFNADWKFECYAANVPMEREFPEQFCGNGTNQLTYLRKVAPFDESEGLAHMLLYYHLFNNDMVVQTEPECVEATSIFTQCGDDEVAKAEVMRNCFKILFKPNLAKCVSRYNCGPMEVFNNCLRWGCNSTVGVGAFSHDTEEQCYTLAEHLDQCPNVTGLTDTITPAAKKCYKDFIPLVRELDDE